MDRSLWLLTRLRAKGMLRRWKAAMASPKGIMLGLLTAFLFVPMLIGPIAAKGLETMSQGAAEFSRKQFESATAAMKTLAATRSPTEFMKLHSDYVRSMFDTMVAETSKSTEMLLKLANDVAQPLSNRAAIAVDKMKVAA